jgi:hypothetical protein
MVSSARRAHGGAHGSLSGKRNGNYRHGLYTAEAMAERKATRAAIVAKLKRFSAAISLGRYSGVK